ncbi:MAG: lamin tail domain-containing protein [Chloroflexi bacterium]|nr:lamin tail domain-containing protein [Chloroflexota bacterium]
MHRARQVGLLLLALGMVVTSIGISVPPERGTVPEPAIVPAAVVGWPPSSALLIAEVVTGGTSASDEYVELTNAGSATLDLAGFEIAYAAATGTTASRKVQWSVSRFLDPGQHLLAANVAGLHAAAADATWSGGIAATGGTIILRTAAGTVIDAVGWGDATNAWVEGAACTGGARGLQHRAAPGRRARQQR